MKANPVSSFLFYDLETSGLNKCFDQVLQFAAIRTDLNLQEIERHEILVKLNPDIIPSPSALLVHKLDLEKMQQGVCEYEALREIHRLFNTPGTITVGYNNLGFDDEFLRFSFYRNLLAPYTHQYANNCSRMDIYPMVMMYYLFKPQAINWPKIAGVVSLKLENLSASNNLTTGSSHHAMSDVEATLRLAQLLKKEPEMWEYLRSCFDKKTDLARLKKLTFFADQYQQALLIDGVLGTSNFYQSFGISLGLHQHYKNQSLWLPLDAFWLAAVKVNADIASTTFIHRKRFGEVPILLPTISRFTKYLNDERFKLVAANLAWLQNNPKLFLEIANYHREYKYPEIPDLEIDAALYQTGFVSDSERRFCDNFHADDVWQKLACLDNFSPVMRTQAIRIFGRNYPTLLATREDLHAEFMVYLQQVKSGARMVNYKNEIRLTPAVAVAEIERLKRQQNLSALQSQLLVDLARYIQSW